MAIRVLVVDDSPTIRRVVGAVLARHGFDSLEAEDGEVALDELLNSARAGRDSELNGAGKIDIVLVDFVMPKMNGFQLCRAIRQNDLLHSIPIVLMSAKSDRIREHFVQQTGAIDAISKPFDARALIAVIENAIRRTNQRRSRADSTNVELEDVDVPDTIRTTPTEPVSRVSLSGDVSVIPIGAVLQLLQLESQTGMLVATSADGRSEVTIAMRQGLIDLVQAQGAGIEFRLGRYFLERGLVSAEDIDRLLGERVARADPSWQHKLLGDLLVESGLVTREQLSEALARQSSELVYDLLRWPQGRFEFRRESTPAAERARLGLPVASVVMEGFRRVDEWRLVEGGLGSFDSVLLADSTAIEAGGVDRLAASEQKLLAMVNGERTLRQIVEQSHMSSFDACKILFQLLEARLVRRRSA
jgi:DNA-binding response OmpR family regulator